MRCKKAEKLFSEYLLGDISPRDKTLLEEHLDSCLPCTESLSVYRELFNHYPESSINEPSELYFDMLPGKVLARVKSEDTESCETVFSPFRYYWWKWWKPISAFSTVILALVVVFRILPGGTITPSGTLPDLTGIDQAESYTEFLSSIEYTDESLVLDDIDTSINGTLDADVWYSDTDTVDSILLFSDEEQEEIFNEIKERMS